MKSLSAKTFQCGVTIQGLTTLSGTVYLTALTNTATWDYIVVGTTAQGQLYTRTYAQIMSDITSGIGLSGYVPTSRTLTINGVTFDLTANRSWTISSLSYVSKLQHTVKAGVSLTKGQAVYVTGADGTNMIVGLASNASEATSSKTMGLVDATVSANGFVSVVTEGLLAGLDTSTAGTEGDPVWLGTGGNLIYGLAGKPYAPAHLVFIGIVTRKNNSNGEIFVKVQNGFELNEIHDIDLITTAPINGHLLGYNGTLWVNKTIATWLGYTPANASGTTNYISKFTGSTTLGNSQIFDNGSNVGIGTTAPATLLSLGAYSGSRLPYINGTANTFNAQGITVTSSNTANAAIGGGIDLTNNVHSVGSFSPLISFSALSQGGTYNNNYAAIYGILAGDSGDGNWNSGHLVFATALAFGASEKVRITNAGNVGIGTTIPSEKLVVSNGGAAGFEWIPATGRWYRYNRSTSAYAGIYTEASEHTWSIGASEAMRINASGNVGIGTTTPSDRLDILGAGSQFIKVANTGTYLMRFGIDSSNNGYIGSSNATPIGLHTNGVNRLFITTGGNVGIGTTSPDTPLFVQGGASGTGGWNRTATLSATYPGLIFNSNGTKWGGMAYDYSAAMRFWVNANNNDIFAGTLALSILNNGNIGIGTSDPGTNKLHVFNGSSGGVAYNPGGLVVESSGRASIQLLAPNNQDSYLFFGDANSGTGGYIGHYGTTMSPPDLMVYYSEGNHNFTNGNVGIGTTSPTNRFQIGSVGSSGYGGNDIAIGNGTQVMAFYQSSTISTWYTNTSFALMPSGGGSIGNLGIGTDSPTQRVHVSGNLRVTGAFYDSNNQSGTSGQILKSTGSGTDWVSLSEITGVDGTGTANYVTKWSDADTIANSLIYDNGTNVGIGTASPGYNFDVNGQVRVQDKLRVGTVNSGNGVVHMSFSATINPSATTIVWAQNVSVGMCAFIEYYILNNNSLTDQRAGTIIVTWNQSGTPTIAHTETTTPDIGSTIAVNFTSSLVGSDARINAVNSSANPYTIVMSYKYF